MATKKKPVPNTVIPRYVPKRDEQEVIRALAALPGMNQELAERVAKEETPSNEGVVIHRRDFATDEEFFAAISQRQEEHKEEYEKSVQAFSIEYGLTFRDAEVVLQVKRLLNA